MKFNISDCEFFLYEAGKYVRLNLKEILNVSIKTLCLEPYVFKFELENHGKVYFVGHDDPYLTLTSQGKEVLWLHDFFAKYQELLIQKGHSPHTSITGYTLGHLKTVFDVYEMFPGTKEECGCQDCAPKNLEKIKWGVKG